MRRTWTDDDLIQAVRQSRCVTHVAVALGLSPKGGNYATLKKHIARLQLDTSHFETTEEKILRAQRLSVERARYTLSSVLSIFSEHTQCHSTHKRYAKLLLDSSKCSVCGNPPIWNGLPLVLQLDHINGDKTDNRLDNLRWICPNCHTQTPNFSGRCHNPARFVTPPEKKSYRCSCGAPIQRRSNKCKDCVRKAQLKIQWPPLEELLQRVSDSNFSRLALELGVSDNAIRKHIKRETK